MMIYIWRFGILAALPPIIPGNRAIGNMKKSSWYRERATFHDNSSTPILEETTCNLIMKAT